MVLWAVFMFRGSGFVNEDMVEGAEERLKVEVWIRRSRFANGIEIIKNILLPLMTRSFKVHFDARKMR